LIAPRGGAPLPMTHEIEALVPQDDEEPVAKLLARL
jgi:hypothetical protein